MGKYTSKRPKTKKVFLQHFTQFTQKSYFMGFGPVFALSAVWPWSMIGFMVDEYNRFRPHSSLSYLTPVEYRQQWISCKTLTRTGA